MYRKQVFMTMMQNYNDILTNNEAAINSEGVAMQKQEIYMQSLGAKLTELTARWEAFFQNSLNSDLFKGIVTGLSFVLSGFDNLGKVLGIVGPAFIIFNSRAIAAFIVNMQKIPGEIAKSVSAMIGLTAATSAEVVAKETQIAATQQQIATDTAYIVSARAEIETLLTQTAATGGSTAAINSRIAALQIQIAETEGTIAAGQTEILTLEGQAAASKKAAASALLWQRALGIASVALIAITIAVMAFSSAQEDAKQAIEESNNKYKEHQSELKNILSYYESNYKAVKENSEVKKQFFDMQNQLIDTFGKEAEGIDLVNGKYDDQIKKINELNNVNLKKTINEQKLTVDVLKNKKVTMPTGKINEMEGGFYRVGSELKEGSESKYSNITTKKDYVTTDIVTRYEKLEELLSKIREHDTSIFEIGTKLPQTTEDWKIAESQVLFQLKEIEDNYNVITNQQENERKLALSNVEAASKLSDQQKSAFSGVSQAYNAFMKTNAELKNMPLDEYATKMQNISDILKKFDGKNIEDIKSQLIAITQLPQATIDKLFDSVINSTFDYAKANEAVSEQAEKTGDSLKELNQIIADQSKGEKLNAEQVLNLTTKYPQLRDAVIDVGDGYLIQKDALEQVRLAQLGLYDTTAEAQVANAKNTLMSIESQLISYGVLISAIQDSASAQAALAKIPKYSNDEGDYETSQVGRDFAPQITSAKAAAASEAEYTIGKLNELYKSIESKRNLLSSPDYGVSSSGSSGSSGDSSRAEAKTNAQLLERDLYYEINQALIENNNLLDKNRAAQEIDQNNKIKLMKLMREEIDIMKQRQYLLHLNAETLRGERGGKIEELQSYGFNIEGEGDQAKITNYDEIISQQKDLVDSHRDDEEGEAYQEAKAQLDKMEDLAKRFFDIQNSELPKLQQNWITLKKEIGSTANEILKVDFDISKEATTELDKQFQDIENAISGIKDEDYDKLLDLYEQKIKVAAERTKYWNEQLENFKDSPEIIADINKMISDNEKAIEEANKALEETRVNQAQAKIDLYKDTEDQIVDLLKKSREEEKKIEEKKYEVQKEVLDKSLEDYTEYVDGRISEIERLSEAEDYDDKVKESTDKIIEYNEEINKYSLAAKSGDLEAIEKVSELTKQKDEEETTLKKEQKDRSRTLQKQSLQDNLKEFEKHINTQKDILEKEEEAYKETMDKILEDTNIQLEAQKILMTGTVEDVTKVITDLFTVTGENATELGKTIQDNVIAKIASVREIVGNLGDINNTIQTKGVKPASSTTTPTTSTTPSRTKLVGPQDLQMSEPDFSKYLENKRLATTTFNETGVWDEKLGAENLALRNKYGIKSDRYTYEQLAEYTDVTAYSDYVGPSDMKMAKADYAKYLENKRLATERFNETGTWDEALAKANLALRNKYGITSDTYTYDELLKYKDIPGYAEGGVVEKTGLAMLHGKPGAIETVLNASQGKRLLDFIDNVRINPIVPKLSGSNGLTINLRSLLNVEGNVTEDILPSIQNMLKEAKGQIFTTLKREINKVGGF